MGQSINGALLTDVQIKFSKEGCALDMEHHDHAKAKDAQRKLKKEEYV